MGNGGLPSSRLPHKGKSLPFGEVEADTVYGILTGIGIGKRNVLECHITSGDFLRIFGYWEWFATRQVFHPAYGLICQKHILLQIHHFHHIGCYHRSNQHIQEHIGDDGGNVFAFVADKQYDYGDK